MSHSLLSCILVLSGVSVRDSEFISKHLAVVTVSSFQEQRALSTRHSGRELLEQFTVWSLCALHRANISASKQASHATHAESLEVAPWAVMAAALPVELSSAVDAIASAVTAAESALAPFCEAKLGVAAKRLSPLDNARMNTALAFGVTSLLYAHLRLDGRDLKNHEVMTEVKGVRALFSRIDEADKLQKARAGEKLTSLDVAASSRMISSAISSSNFTGGKRARPADAEPEPAAGRADKRPRAASDSSSDSEDSDAGGKAASSSAGANTAVGRGGSAAGRGRGGGRGGKGKGADDSKRSTPQPRLSHLNWKAEMDKKFGAKR
jgi:hypothetical protein